MNRTLPIIFAVLLAVFVAAGTVNAGKFTAPNTAEGAVQYFFDAVKARNFNAAYDRLANQNSLDRETFVRDLSGRDGSLRTYSNLQKVETRVLNENQNDALVRANIQWSTAVGAFYETRDLRAVRDDGGWKVEWAAEKPAKLPPQVIPVNYLRWDIVHSGGGDEFGAQNVEAPRPRVVNMNAVERDGNTIIVGELMNEDTVPGFFAITATLLGQNGEVLGEEASFDKISHTLLPKEVSPFRIDFPGVKLSQVKNVRIQPNSTLVPASADPVIGVLNQRIEKDARGKAVLRGELVNQSGQTVNIPHVLASFYDNTGKVVWVSDGYVDKALLPQSPVPFAVEVRDDLAGNIQSYRVTVNHYSRDRVQ